MGKLAKSPGSDPGESADSNSARATKSRRFAVKEKRKYGTYLEFLEAAVNSESLKRNDPKEWKKLEKKLKKERLLVKWGIKKGA